MEIVPLIDPFALHQDGKDDLTGDWVISTKSITLTAGTLTAEQITSTDDITAAGTVTAEQLTSTDDIEAGDTFFGSSGLVGTPSFAFTADSSTGMYNEGANIIGFTTAGTKKFSISETAITAYLPLRTGSLLDINQSGVAGYHGIALTTDVTTTEYEGIVRNYVNYFNVNPSANTDVIYQAMQGRITTPTTNTRNFADGVYGLGFSSYFRGQGTCVRSIGTDISSFGVSNTGILTEAIGAWGRAGGVGVGKVTNGYVFLAEPYCTSSGAGYLTNSYGYYLRNSSMSTNAENAYGIYLEDVNYGDTLNYAIYSAGGQSYHAGNFDIGSADIGDGTNDLVISSTGVVSMTGTARPTNALWIGANAVKAPPTKAADFVDHGISGAWEFSDATDDTIVANMRIPNRMDRTVAPTFTLGWSSTTQGAFCEWQVEYLWRAADEDTTAGADDTLLSSTDAAGTSTSSATAEGLVLTTFTLAAPSATDACLHLRIKRRGDLAGDTINGDTVELHGICMNYTSNKLGS